MIAATILLRIHICMYTFIHAFTYIYIYMKTLCMYTYIYTPIYEQCAQLNFA